jgi:hypothetical protein
MRTCAPALDAAMLLARMPIARQRARAVESRKSLVARHAHFPLSRLRELG